MKEKLIAGLWLALAACPCLSADTNDGAGNSSSQALRSAPRPASAASGGHHMMGMTRPPQMDDARWQEVQKNPTAHMTRTPPHKWNGERPKTIQEEQQQASAPAAN